jgi:hypothetical protein
VVKNALKWKIGYAAYLVRLKNGGAGVAVVVDGKDEALGQMTFHLVQGATSPLRMN